MSDQAVHKVAGFIPLSAELSNEMRFQAESFEGFLRGGLRDAFDPDVRDERWEFVEQPTTSLGASGMWLFPRRVSLAVDTSFAVEPFPRVARLRDRLSDAAVRVRTSTADRLQNAAQRVGGNDWDDGSDSW